MIITARLYEGRHRTRLTIRFVLWSSSYILWFSLLPLVFILSWVWYSSLWFLIVPRPMPQSNENSETYHGIFSLTGLGRPFIVCSVGESGRIWRANIP